VIYAKMEMNPATKDAIQIGSEIAGISAFVLLFADFIFNRRGYLKRLGHWLRRQLVRLKPDHGPATLDLPPPIPAAELPIATVDGVSKVPVMYIMRGHEKLLAYEVTRQGFPGTRFLVVRERSGEEPKSLETPNQDEATAKWQEWYREWQQQPGGFAGASGTGLDGKPPW
jgi:hypothetical protein